MVFLSRSPLFPISHDLRIVAYMAPPFLPPSAGPCPFPDCDRSRRPDPTGVQRAAPDSSPALRPALPPMTYPQPVIDRIIAMAATGLSHAEIARRISFTRSCVTGILWRRGVKAPKAPTVVPIWSHDLPVEVVTASAVPLLGAGRQCLPLAGLRRGPGYAVLWR